MRQFLFHRFRELFFLCSFVGAAFEGVASSEPCVLMEEESTDFKSDANETPFNQDEKEPLEFFPPPGDDEMTESDEENSDDNGENCRADDEKGVMNASDDHAVTAHVAWVYVLDKSTAQTQVIEVPVGNDGMTVGSLKICAKLAFKSPPYERQDCRAYLEISEHSAEDPVQDSFFEGWMSSAYPSVGEFKHAAYDVWLQKCE